MFSVQHNWETMKEAIQSHIGSLNWNYRVQLRTENVTYLNAYGEFIGPHKLKVCPPAIHTHTHPFHFYFFSFLNHCVPVSQANWCNTVGNLFPSHSCPNEASIRIQTQVTSMRGGRLTNWAIPPPLTFPPCNLILLLHPNHLWSHCILFLFLLLFK